MDELRECCELMLKLLTRLWEDGKISDEEFKKAAKLKKAFLNKAP